LEECGPCPVLASITMAFALQPRKKHGKTSVRVLAASRNTNVKHKREKLQIKKKETLAAIHVALQEETQSMI